MRLLLKCLAVSACVCSLSATAQVKYILDDFEGLNEDPGTLKEYGIFTFGCVKGVPDNKLSNQRSYSGDRSLKIYRASSAAFGGWGIGANVNVELDYSLDYFNFFVMQPNANGSNTLRIEIQEDDDASNSFDKNNDDSWEYTLKLDAKNAWELVSVPLNKFKDANNGGDSKFNATYKEGKILTILFTFPEVPKMKNSFEFNFDFLSFSQGALPTAETMFDAPMGSNENGCSIGAWSKEGNMANFSDIASSFEGTFRPASLKKLGVVHLFQPFAVDGGSSQNFYPSVERLNKLLRDDYIPMITLEDHFVNAHPSMKQPNLYSIIEGHFDSFFTEWAGQIKTVQGTVLLRILHEFNGDWYPWCTVNNDKDPKLVVKAYRHIHDIFRRVGANNVKFIWCPNSMSIPQESWNYIMEAYPGDEYVDFVGLDIYNGAGKATTWRSFRKEAAESYFIATQKLKGKPLLICEVASRERGAGETGQTKSEWIRQMSQAMKADFADVRLLAWFNEKSSFKVNSTDEARVAFLNAIMKDGYFRSGPASLKSYLTK